MTTRRNGPFVLFVAAAGPDIGFGHLVRAGVLADALGAARVMTLRGPMTSTLAALRLGWTVHRGSDLLTALQPDLVVVDEPSPAERMRWVQSARHADVPVALICDGDSEQVDADVVIDGAFTAAPDHRAHRHAGAAWAILPARTLVRRRRPLVRHRRHVLVALGGGVHSRRVGATLADALTQLIPGVQVDIAAGFADEPRIALPHDCRWLLAPAGLTDSLASTTVAVVAGGITLYEACALGTPAVAVPVVAAQRRAIRACATAQGVVGVSQLRPLQVARAVRRLVDSPDRAASLGRRAAQLVDGKGTTRAVARLRALIGGTGTTGVWHAA